MTQLQIKFFEEKNLLNWKSFVNRKRTKEKIKDNQAYDKFNLVIKSKRFIKMQ